MSYIDIDTLIARAQTTIPTANTTDKLIWMEWAWIGLGELGFGDDDVRACTIYPKNFLAKKPSDMRTLIDLSLFDSEGNELKHIYRTGGKRIYPDQRTEVTGAVPVDISDDRYNFILGTNGDQVAQIVIRYFAYPIDEKTNLPLIKEEETMALIYFLRYMWALRKNENQSEIAQSQLNWFRESDRVRARKKMDSLTPEKAKAIGRNWMRLIPSFRFEDF